MDTKGTTERELWFELNLAALRRSALEALRTFFTPIRMVARITLVAWKKLQNALINRSAAESASGKDSRVRSRGGV